MVPGTGRRCRPRGGVAGRRRRATFAAGRGHGVRRRGFALAAVARLLATGRRDRPAAGIGRRLVGLRRPRAGVRDAGGAAGRRHRCRRHDAGRRRAGARRDPVGRRAGAPRGPDRVPRPAARRLVGRRPASVHAGRADVRRERRAAAVRGRTHPRQLELAGPETGGSRRTRRGDRPALPTRRRRRHIERRRPDPHPRSARAGADRVGHGGPGRLDDRSGHRSRERGRARGARSHARGDRRRVRPRRPHSAPARRRGRAGRDHRHAGGAFVPGGLPGAAFRADRRGRRRIPELVERLRLRQLVSVLRGAVRLLLRVVALPIAVRVGRLLLLGRALLRRTGVVGLQRLAGTAQEPVLRGIRLYAGPDAGRRGPARTTPRNGRRRRIGRSKRRE